MSRYGVDASRLVRLPADLLEEEVTTCGVGLPTSSMHEKPYCSSEVENKLAGEFPSTVIARRAPKAADDAISLDASRCTLNAIRNSYQNTVLHPYRPFDRLVLLVLGVLVMTRGWGY